MFVLASYIQKNTSDPKVDGKNISVKWPCAFEQQCMWMFLLIFSARWRQPSSLWGTTWCLEVTIAPSRCGTWRTWDLRLPPYAPTRLLIGKSSRLVWCKNSFLKLVVSEEKRTMRYLFQIFWKLKIFSVLYYRSHKIWQVQLW